MVQKLRKTSIIKIRDFQQHCWQFVCWTVSHLQEAVAELDSWSLNHLLYFPAIKNQVTQNGENIKWGCSERVHLAKAPGMNSRQTTSKHIQHRRSCRCSWLFLMSRPWKYLEVPPFKVQELRAPDVMPDEDILILTKTEVLKPRRNLLRSPEVNCQRWKSKSALSTQNPRRQGEMGTPQHSVPEEEGKQDHRQSLRGRQHTFNLEWRR